MKENLTGYTHILQRVLSNEQTMADYYKAIEGITSITEQYMILVKIDLECFIEKQNKG